MKWVRIADKVNCFVTLYVETLNWVNKLEFWKKKITSKRLWPNLLTWHTPVNGTVLRPKKYGIVCVRYRLMQSCISMFMAMQLVMQAVLDLASVCRMTLHVSTCCQFAFTSTYMVLTFVLLSVLVCVSLPLMCFQGWRIPTRWPVECLCLG